MNVDAMIRNVAVAADGKGRRHLHSPRVRRLASEAGVSLEALNGTGPGGRVSRDDVRKAAAAAAAEEAGAAGEGGAAPVVVSGKVLARAQTATQATTVVEIDVSAVAALCERLAPDFEASHGIRLTLTSFFAKAALETLRTQPQLNMSVSDDGHTVVPNAKLRLGISVDTPMGLLVPVVMDADDLNLLGLARRVDELAHRARTGAASVDDLSGGTFTLTNNGDSAALWVTPVLVPGQVAGVGSGAVVERPVVVRGHDGDRAIAIRSMAHFALTYDQRFITAAEAILFLTSMKSRIEAARFHFEVA